MKTKTRKKTTKKVARERQPSVAALKRTINTLRAALDSASRTEFLLREKEEFTRQAHITARQKLKQMAVANHYTDVNETDRKTILELRRQIEELRTANVELLTAGSQQAIAELRRLRDFVAAQEPPFNCGDNSGHAYWEELLARCLSMIDGRISACTSPTETSPALRRDADRDDPWTTP